MTNILNLPQFPAGAAFVVEWGADWNDQVYVPGPGFGGAVAVAGSISSGQNTVTGIASTAGVVTGMLAQAYGIPSGAAVSGVSSNSITLSENATQSGNVTVSLFPPPLDLTGISFSSSLRQSATSTTVILSMTTANGLMINSGSAGIFGWAVPGARLKSAPFPSALSSLASLSCVLDVVATDANGLTINLCQQSGPLPVIVNFPVTR